MAALLAILANCSYSLLVMLLGEQRKLLTETLSLGEEILSKSHQEAVPVMKKWIAVLKQRMDDIDALNDNFEKSIQVS